MTAEHEPETVHMARLVNSEFLPDGKVRQTHELVQIAGVFIVCEADAVGQPWRQHFECGGQTYHSIDEAIAGRDGGRDIRDCLAESIRRCVHGLIRPLWADLPSEQRQAWLRAADLHLRIIGDMGLKVVREARQ